MNLSEAEREAIERLERDVIQPSMSALVILEFCTQPSPVLAKLADSPRGLVLGRHEPRTSDSPATSNASRRSGEVASV